MANFCYENYKLAENLFGSQRKTTDCLQLAMARAMTEQIIILIQQRLR